MDTCIPMIGRDDRKGLNFRKILHHLRIPKSIKFTFLQFHDAKVMKCDKFDHKTQPVKKIKFLYIKPGKGVQYSIY